MHIGKRFYKGVSVLCALVLSFSLVMNEGLVVHAEETVDVSLPKLLDITLTAQGVVASGAVLDSVASKMVQYIQDSAQSVVDSMVTAGETTWDNVANYIGEAIEDNGVQKVLTVLFDDGTLTDEILCPTFTAVEIATAFSPNEHGGAGRERGKTYTLDEDVICTTNKVFQDWIVENEDYYLYRVPAFTEIDTKYFHTDTYTFASNFFQAIAVENEPYYIYTQYSASNYVYSGVLDIGCFENKDCYFYVNGVANDSFAYPCYDGLDYPMSYYGIYDSEGVFQTRFSSDTIGNYSILDLETSDDYTSDLFYYRYTYNNGGTDLLTTRQYVGFVGRNAFVIKLMKEENTTIDIDSQNVYYTPDYDTNTNTPVTYTGDYYCNTYNTYNYTTVQDDINNISGDLTNSIVDSVVDNSVTEIVNNYNYVEPEATAEPLVTLPPDLGETDKDGDGEVSLTEFFQGIKDLIAWLLNTLGSIASLIAGLGEGILSILNTFTGLFSGFSGLLGTMFVFIPQELLDALTAGISAIVLVALYNMFLGGKN